MSAEPSPLADPRRALACAVALSSLHGVGPATLLACWSGPGAEAAWEGLRSGRGGAIRPLAEAANRLERHEADPLARLARDARSIDAEALLARHLDDGQQVEALGSPGYPARLLDDDAPPAVLFLRGDDACLGGPTVAIVGTRNATRLGRDTAAGLAVALADRGISVVSGLALGIDGAAHSPITRRAGGGVPIGVVATGLERAYPPRHRRLQQEVADSGLLVSESPIGSVPTRWRFPARNRIIAALADAVVVVESRSVGGSMLTAAEAVARDRPLLAVPGHPTSAASAGTLDLIADGAVPVRDVDDVLVAIGLGGAKPVLATGSAGARTGAVAVSRLATELLDGLGANPRTLGELVALCGAELEAASTALVELEQAGLIRRSGAWFERTASGAVEEPGPSR